jgi:hypothetical protein
VEQRTRYLLAREGGGEGLNQDKGDLLNLCVTHVHPVGVKVWVTKGFEGG